MPIVNKQAQVPYSCEQMFSLVDDISAYPEFLPWCKTTVEHDRDPDEVRATIVLAFSGLEKAFTTLNRLHKPKMMEIRLVDGPFKHLEGFWRFTPLDNGSIVSLDMEFEFKHKWVAIAFSKIFEEISNQLVDAFVQRAQSVYG